jgi:RimJ/RimL family protein N-acetyltransferase
MDGPRAVSYDERFLERSWVWLQDPEIQRLTMTPALSRETQANWFASLPDRSDYKIWGIEMDGDPIGAFGLKNIIDGSRGEYWGYIGEKGYWGCGVGTWMLESALAFAREAGLRQVWLRVSRENERAIRLYVRNGFTPNDEREDSILMAQELA